MKFEGDVASVGGPSRPSGRSVQGRKLVASGAIGCTCPDIPEAKAIRLEGNFLSIGRQIRAHLVALLRNQDGGRLLMVPLIFQGKAPDVELVNHLLVHQLVTLCRDRRPTCLAHGTSNWSRYASGRRYSPQALRTSTRGREDDFATVCRPGGR